MIERHLGPAAEVGFLTSLSSSVLTLEQIVPADIERMAELVSSYADLPLGAVDASVVAIADRLGATTLLSLDRRHFTVVRPADTAAFTLLP